jgi:RND superfamily putative drug exporter
VLVPATMELLGNANWWLPKWLDRLIPRISVEAPPDLATVPPSAATEPERTTPVASGGRAKR